MRRRLAAATATLTGALFFAVFLLVHSVNGRPLRLDRWATGRATSHRPEWAVHLARAVTTLGTPIVVYPVVIVIAVVAVTVRKRWWTVLAPLILLATQTVRRLIADAVKRPRPPQNLHLTGSSGWSFPSGHTTLATTGYALAALIILMSLSTERARRPVRALNALGAATLAVAVGLSRIELGVHWLTDVVGGWLLGGFVVSLVVIAIPAAPQEVSPDR